MPLFFINLLYTNSNNKSKKHMILKTKLYSGNSKKVRKFELNVECEDEPRTLTKSEKRRENSRFGYKIAGGSYVPSEGQFNFCLRYPWLFKTDTEKYARDEIICGFLRKKEINHDYIHIVNVKRRKFYEPIS